VSGSTCERSRSPRPSRSTAARALEAGEKQHPRPTLEGFKVIQDVIEIRRMRGSQDRRFPFSVTVEAVCAPRMTLSPKDSTGTAPDSQTATLPALCCAVLMAEASNQIPCAF
jgi:hypothetical protein